MRTIETHAKTGTSGLPVGHHPGMPLATAALAPAGVAWARLPRTLPSALLGAVLGALLALGAPGNAQATDAPGVARLRDAQASAGRKLIAEHSCTACHARKVGGDGSAIYRPNGRINTPAALLGMVEMCNTELGLQMFPEDVADVAAALNADHYRFKLTPP